MMRIGSSFIEKAALVMRAGVLMIAVSIVVSVSPYCTDGQASAQGIHQTPKWKNRRPALDQMHGVDEFRIFYSLNGPDALPNRSDSNGNGIPDFVDNLAIQIVTARRVYVEVLKLRHPLMSARYKGRAKYIDVNVGALRKGSSGRRIRGSAGDAVVNFKRIGDPKGGIQTLTMDVLNTLKPQNLTPAHELFHLFQYGYTMFKNKWFLEGAARWVEYAFRKGSGKQNGLPQSIAERRELFAMTYRASGFWIALAHAADPHGEIRVPQDLRNVTYIGSKAKVVQDELFYGSDLLKRLLESLDEADDVASREYRLAEFSWKERQQKSADNNRYIWAEVIRLAGQFATASPELSTMIKTLRATP